VSKRSDLRGFVLSSAERFWPRIWAHRDKKGLLEVVNEHNKETSEVFGEVLLKGLS